MSFETNIKLFIIFILLLNLTQLLNALPSKPEIDSAKQLSEGTIELKWDADEDKNPLLERYRIFYSRDGFESDFNEWPAQTEPLTMTSDHNRYYVKYNASSSFDCYSQCLRYPTCLAAVDRFSNFKRGENCFMKTNWTTGGPTELYQEEIDFTDSKQVRIKKYSNKVLLTGLPSNEIYHFFVAVYDKAWSKPSDASESVDTKIRMIIDYSQRDNQSVNIYWSQLGTFRNNIISRYIIKVWSDNDPNYELESSDQNRISKYDDIEQNFYELTTSSSHVVSKEASSESGCFETCIKTPKCIRYALSPRNECHLIYKINLHKSFHGSTTWRSSALKSSSRRYKIKNLIPFTEYKVKVEYITPFGATGESNTLNIMRQYHDVPFEIEGDDQFDSPFNYDINKEQQQQQDTSVESNESDEIETSTKQNIISTTSIDPITTTDTTQQQQQQQQQQVDETTTTVGLIVYPIVGGGGGGDDGIKKSYIKGLMLQLKNVTTKDDKTYLQIVDKKGRLQPGTNVQGHIEWSKDFNNRTVPVYKHEFNEKLGNDNEIEIDAKVPEFSTAQVVLKDDFGYSMKTDQIVVQCSGEECFESKIKQSEESRVTEKKKATKIYITVILVLIGILIAVLIIYSIVSCIRMSKKDEKKGDNVGNQKYLPVSATDNDPNVQRV